ncbi:DUF2127 domain-containing protein [Dyella sp. 333MFSha]|uniref:DUF2127 domain-containing protein n=1 Tax=Dyella sp. 333MFSha TaxID=1798240 RepID=UPI00088FDEE3|nr:DUF2127 domain-containing protein [Dyella sp. 333MFSha]SDG17064.1 Uncharacterized membrane protein, DUF2068 family [Dyella sp. 333MFSha]
MTSDTKHPAGLRIIAVYKAVKTVGLILIASAAFHLDREDSFRRLVQWLEHLQLTDSNDLRWSLVHLLQQMGPAKVEAVGIVALIYAAIFATEGIGLWMRKHWAEWFTVIATGSLVPVEIYECIVRFGWLKVAILVANVLIVVYLVRLALRPRGGVAVTPAAQAG